MTRPCDLNATEARKLIGNKQLSPVELTKSCLEQLEKLNPSINAVVAIDKNDVLKQAKKAEEDVSSVSNECQRCGETLNMCACPEDDWASTRNSHLIKPGKKVSRTAKNK